MPCSSSGKKLFDEFIHGGTALTMSIICVGVRGWRRDLSPNVRDEIFSLAR
jgi:hypothetical protein